MAASLFAQYLCGGAWRCKFPPVRPAGAQLPTASRTPTPATVAPNAGSRAAFPSCLQFPSFREMEKRGGESCVGIGLVAVVWCCWFLASPYVGDRHVTPTRHLWPTTADQGQPRSTRVDNDYQDPRGGGSGQGRPRVCLCRPILPMANAGQCLPWLPCPPWPFGHFCHHCLLTPPTFAHFCPPFFFAPLAIFFCHFFLFSPLHFRRLKQDAS